MCELTSAVSVDLTVMLALAFVWSFLAGWAIGRFG
jgi:hypothetical protein